HAAPARPNNELHPQQLARLLVTGGPAFLLVLLRVTVHARGHARQGHQLPPPERRPRRRELLRYRPVVLLRVQPAVLADRVTQEQVEQRPGLVATLAIPGRQRRGSHLVVLADRAVQLLEQGGPVRRLHLLQVLRVRQRLLVVGRRLVPLGQRVAARGVHRGQDQAGRPVPRARHADDVPPGVGRVRRVYARRVPVRPLAVPAALPVLHLPQHQLVRRQRDR